MSVQISSPSKRWPLRAMSRNSFIEPWGSISASDEAWLDEAKDRLAAYDRGEIASCTLAKTMHNRRDSVRWRSRIDTR
jgi:hypothetical protein